MPTNVLILSAHPDDETLGCHYAIAQHLKHGDHVTVLLMTSDELRLRECEKALKVNTAFYHGVKLLTANGYSSIDFLADTKLNSQIPPAATAVREVMKDLEPDIVYCHSRLEPSIVPDHRAVYDALMIAAAGYGKPFVLFEYPVWQYCTWPWVDMPRRSKGKPFKLWLTQCFTYCWRTLTATPTIGKGKYYDVVVHGDRKLKTKAMSFYRSQLPMLQYVAAGQLLEQFYKREVFHKSYINKRHKV